MAIDRGFLGYSLPPFSVTASEERVRKFARAVGITDPEVSVAPPTFMKAVEGENNSSRRILEAMAVPLQRVLHVEQQFDYVAPIRVGDVLSVKRTVTDIYDKKAGAMEFVVIESHIARDDGAPVGRSRQVILVRNPPART